MDNQLVTKAVFNLVPLMVLLLIVFGILLALAVGLRFYVKRKLSPGSSSPGRTSGKIQAGAVVSILGKDFHVTSLSSLATEKGDSLFCRLDGENGQARLLLTATLNSACYFPGRLDFSESEPYPKEIKKDQESYLQMGEPIPLEENQKLIRYQAANERFLILEIKDGRPILWKGKSIPPEGVVILE